MLYIFLNLYITKYKGENMGLEIKKYSSKLIYVVQFFIFSTNFRRNLKKFRNFFKHLIYFFLTIYNKKIKVKNMRYKNKKLTLQIY